MLALIFLFIGDIERSSTTLIQNVEMLYKTKKNVINCESFYDVYSFENSTKTVYLMIYLINFTDFVYTSAPFDFIYILHSTSFLFLHKYKKDVSCGHL